MNGEVFENRNVIYNIETQAAHTLSGCSHHSGIGRVTGEIHKQRASKMLMVSWNPVLLLSRMMRKHQTISQSVEK